MGLVVMRHNPSESETKSMLRSLTGQTVIEQIVTETLPALDPQSIIRTGSVRLLIRTHRHSKCRTWSRNLNRQTNFESWEHS